MAEQLNNLLDQRSQNLQMQNALKKSIKSIFPLEAGGKKLVITNLNVNDNLDENDFPQQKELKLDRKSWQIPITADLSLQDMRGKELDHIENIKIGNIPKITNRFTAIIDGNEYQTVNQIRRKSGIYSHVQKNGELIAEFNLAKGQNFKMQLDPSTQRFVIVYSNRKYRLWTLLNVIGVPDSDIKEKWGATLLNINKEDALNTEVSEMTSIYKIIFKKDPKDYSEVIDGLRKYFTQDGYTELDKDTTKVTLNDSFDKVTGKTLLAASMKLLNINKGKEEPDDRDSLIFKKIFSVDDSLLNYFDKQTPIIKKKLVRTLEKKDRIKDIISPATFSEPIKKFFTIGDLSSTPAQTNPVTIAAEWRKTTPMGQGGIQSRHAITMDTRDLQPTHLGFLDPLASPECLLAETKILTQDGWINADKITLEDKIACNINNKLEFHNPEKLHKYNYNGLLYGVKNSKIEYLVTEEHKIYTVSNYVQKRDFKLLPAKDVINKCIRIKTNTLPYEGTNIKYFELPNTNVKIDINDWAEFIGWFLSKGTISTNDNGYTEVRITQSKEVNFKKWSHLSDLLIKLPFTFNKFTHYFSNNLTVELHTYLKSLGQDSFNKLIPEYYFTLPLEARKWLMYGLLAGDGRKIDPKCNKINIFEYKQNTFTTNNSQLAEDVERLAISLGYTVSHIYKYPAHEVRLMVEEDAVIHTNQHYTKLYNGPVYCVTVPGSLIMIKHGKSRPHWTGNSSKIGVAIGLSSEVKKINNDMKTPVYDKNGKETYLSPTEFFNYKVAFPDQYELDGNVIKFRFPYVTAMYKGKTVKIPKTDVDYVLQSAHSLFSFQQNLVPFMANTQGNRASTGARMITQAMSLDNKEAPLVRNYRDKESTYEDLLAQYLVPEAPFDGTVVDITPDYITIKSKDGKKEQRIGQYNNFPLNQDGYLHSTPKFGINDIVKKGEPLFDHNYSDNGTLAIGKNLVTGYMSYKGYNFEDGAVITQGAADKLSHSMIHKINVYFSPKLALFDKSKFNAWFPDQISPETDNKLDSDGIIKVGETVNPGEIICAFLIEKELDDTDKALRKLDKFRFNNYLKNITVWDEDESGIVTDVRKVGRNIDIYIKSKHPLKVGDKISGRVGNKCVSKNTNVLTKNYGIKNISEITINDEIATLNPDTHELEWQKPKSVIAEPINIPYLYKVTGKQIELETTINHKQYVRLSNGINIKSKWDDFALLEAKDIFGKDVKHKRDANWSGTEFDYIQIGKYSVKAENLFSLLGYFITNGETQIAYNDTVFISQPKKNTQELNEIKSLFNICFPNVILEDCVNEDINNMTIKIIDEDLYNYFSKINRNIPIELKDANKDLLSLLLKNLLKENSFEEKSRTTYYTSFNKLADDVFEIGLKLGYAPNMYTIEKNGKIVYAICLNKIYGLNPMVNSGTMVTEEYVPYNDMVYCVELSKYHVFYAILNGKGVWTGNSIITKIIPDSEAPHRPDGTPVEVLMSPEGVPGRMNIGQILETAAGKIATKTGKPYIIDNFYNPDGDEALKIYNEMTSLGIEPNEILTDGKNGKPIDKPIFVGNQYILKLRHIIKKKLGVHNYGVYDIDEQPAGKGAQKIGAMETYAYLAHGAKHNLREATEIKGRKNEEYWRDLQFGLPPGKPERNFVFEKMLAYLKGMGINTEKKGNNIRILPLTDQDTLSMSNGEILDPGAMLKGKNLGSRKNGLFDSEVTGGIKGTQWSHIKLVNKIPNPMYELAIQKILNLTEQKYNSIIMGKEELNGKTGPTAIVDELKNINVNKLITSVSNELKSAPPTNINKLNTKLKYLKTLKELGMTPEKAYTMQYVPIMPPVFRPIYPLPSGDVTVNDVNKFYRDIGLINNGLKATQDNLLELDKTKNLGELYNAVSAMQGIAEPTSFELQKYKGLMEQVDKTKSGLIQGTTWAKRQDLSARSTITVEPDLGLDEVGVPETIAYKMFKPFIIRDMKESGLRASDALKNYDDETNLAKTSLQNVLSDRVVLLNRAPSLHKHSIQAFKPILTDGKSIKLNPLIESAYSADFDGDTMSIMTPVGTEALEEAKSMLPSKILFKHGDNSLVPELTKDYIFGLYNLSLITDKTSKKFKSINEAKASGLKWTSQFDLNGIPMTIGQYMINAELPKNLRNYTRIMDSKTAHDLLEKIGKEKPTFFADVIDSWKNLGAIYSYLSGHTISITDFLTNKNFRNKLLEKSLPEINKLPKKERIDKLNDLTRKIQTDLFSNIKNKNNLSDMLASGSFNKKDSVRQILAMPGVIQDIKGNPIELPILKSYGEGLDTPSYWNTLYGVRKGVIDRSVNTAESGGLNKSLMTVNRRLLVTIDDCNTTKGLEFDINDKNVMDRVLVDTIPGIGKRDSVVNDNVINKARAKGILKLKVRSPLTCEAPNGVCKLCYGLLPNGEFPQIGENVGILDSEAVTERSTQLTMRTFHSGGSALGGGGINAGFPRLEQLINVPEKISNKAILAEESGIVKSITKNPTGGYSININGQKYNTIAGLLPIVEVGKLVEKGEPLTEGVIKPQELGKLKTHLDAQKYMVDEMNNIYKDSGFYKKTFETLVRGISDNAYITKAPEDSGFDRGDKTTKSFVDYLNKKRKKENMDLIEYDPYFKSVETLNTDNDDWLTKVTTNRIKAALRVGAAKGQYGNIKGKDPIPAYIYGDGFGQNTDYEKGEFY